MLEGGHRSGSATRNVLSSGIGTGRMEAVRRLLGLLAVVVAAAALWLVAVAFVADDSSEPVDAGVQWCGTSQGRNHRSF